MGQGLPRPVTSVVVKRFSGERFRVGFAEMNGLRASMEDANVIFEGKSSSFFGVFDGHGGDQCSNFIARRLYEELATGVPHDEAVSKALCLRLDQEFLDTQQPSGSTGTFAIVSPSSASDGKYQMRVGNIGDSRVLLGRFDGAMVEGSGTDGGLTTDHKPDYASETERIERTGGRVELVMGVARVNGDLAVSRSFGDAQHKETGGPAQEDHPVSAEPEFTTIECDGATDFIMLVCDGISEGEFPNRDVIRLAAEQLRSSKDPAVAATAVCREALKQGSQDNLSCMIVLFGGGKLPGAEKELLPGPFDAAHPGFRKAYAAMAEHAGKTLPQALELRYDAIQEQLANAQSGEKKDDASEESPASLRMELESFGDGPPKELASGSADRVEWFSKWLPTEEEDSCAIGNMSREQLLSMLQGNPGLMAMAEAQGIVESDGAAEVEHAEEREVLVGTCSEVRHAVETHSELKWEERHKQVADQEGTVLQDDESDGTSQVRFGPPLGFACWLPTDCLTDVSSNRMVRVAAEKELRQAIEECLHLDWEDRLAQCCGKEGCVLREDQFDGISRVKIVSPDSFIGWLPTAALTDIDPTQKRRRIAHDGESNATADVDDTPAVPDVVTSTPDTKPE